MPEIKVNLRGHVEARKFLIDMAAGAQAFGGTSVAVGTPLPRGLFTDRGTRRGTPRSEWLSGLAGQATGLARQIIVSKMRTPHELASAMVDLGEKIAAMARARAKQRTGKLRGSVQVVARRGVGTRLGRR
jgi:hypothetical protein